MRALVFAGEGRVEIIDAPAPTPTPTGAVIRSTVASLCTSDVHCVHGARALPIGRILGHESVGVVEAVGALVTRFRPGDRVVCGAITSCGLCDQCMRGADAYCEAQDGTMHFVSRRNGTLADYFSVEYADRNLAAIPAGVSDEAAVYTADMLTTGFTAAINAAVPPGGTVVVVGQGPVGLAATMALRTLGAGRIVAIEPDVRRVEKSRIAGADQVVTDTQDLEAVLSAGGGQFDSAVDAVGGATTMNTCVRLVRYGGTISNVGFHTGRDTLELPMGPLRNGMSGHTIRFALTPGGGEFISRILRLIDHKRIDPTILTTHRFGFEDSVAAYKLMENKSDGVLKPIVEWN